MFLKEKRKDCNKNENENKYCKNASPLKPHLYRIVIICRYRCYYGMPAIVFIKELCRHKSLHSFFVFKQTYIEGGKNVTR